MTENIFKLYWIYDKTGWFLGGGIAVDEKVGKKELKWRQQTRPDAYIVWESGVYTYAEAYEVAREKGEEIQRTQPGIRVAYEATKESRNIVKRTKKVLLKQPDGFEESSYVIYERLKDSSGRYTLGTHDQKVIDEARRPHLLQEGK
jgi:hypothetical protein